MGESNQSPLLGKKIYYSYTEEIIHGFDVASHSEYVKHENTGTVMAIGTDSNGEFHFLIKTDNNRLLGFPLNKMEGIKIIKPESPEEEIPRAELLDLE